MGRKKKTETAATATNETATKKKAEAKKNVLLLNTTLQARDLRLNKIQARFVSDSLEKVPELLSSGWTYEGETLSPSERYVVGNYIDTVVKPEFHHFLGVLRTGDIYEDENFEFSFPWVRAESYTKEDREKVSEAVKYLMPEPEASGHIRPSDEAIDIRLNKIARTLIAACIKSALGNITNYRYECEPLSAEEISCLTENLQDLHENMLYRNSPDVYMVMNYIKDSTYPPMTDQELEATDGLYLI